MIAFVQKNETKSHLSAAMENAIEEVLEEEEEGYGEVQEPQIVATTVNYINIGSVKNFNSATNVNHETNDITLPPSPDHFDYDESPLVRKRSLVRRIINKGRTQFGDPTRGLRRKLEEFYQEATLPCVAWLDRGQDLVMNDYYTELQLDTSDTIIPVEKIFAKITKKSPRRILIEGQPGYGKTTLATKIVHDWAMSKNYIKHFRLTFMVSLRELQQRNINDAIVTIAKYSGFKKMDKVKNIVQDNLSQTLLILDGLDELPVNKRLSVLKLLYRQVYSEMTIIVTCRTGLFTLEHEELNLLFGSISKKKVFYDKRIRVLGIGIDDRRKFIQKFLPQTDSDDDVIRQIEKLTKPVGDIFKSPLFLILLVFVASKKKDLTTLATKTQLFKSLFNCIIRRSMKNNATDAEDDVDLFKFGDETHDLQSIIRQFGKLALEHILNNNLQFECNEMTMQIYAMGFLINHKEIFCFEAKRFYEAFHMSILEFAAAFSIWIDFKRLNYGLPGKCLQCIQPLYFRLGKTSLILTFLAGLLQDEADKFFHQLASHAHMFSASEDSLWHLLTECQENNRSERLLEALRDFIPPHVHQWHEGCAQFYASNLCEDIMKYGIENGRIKQIYINNVNRSSLPKNVQIPRLWVEIQPDVAIKQYKEGDGGEEKSKFFENLEYSLRDVECKTIVFRFNTGFSETLGENVVWNYLRLLDSVSKKSCSLCMDGFAIYKTMYEHVNDPIVRNMRFDNLRFHVSNRIGKELITSLLKRNQVEALQLILSYFSAISDPNSVLAAAADSPYLTSLQIVGSSNNTLSVDLYDLTKGGTKKYTCLTVKSSPIVCRKPLTNKTCINTVIIKEISATCQEKTYKSVQGLSMIHPRVLECDAILFEKLPFSWPGYSTLRELALPLDEASNKSEFWKPLSLCRNLKLLELIFPVHGHANIALPVDDVVNCLRQLPVERLTLWRVKAKYGMSQKLIKGVVDSLPWRMKTKDNVRKRIARSLVDSFPWTNTNSGGNANSGLTIPHPLKSVDLVSLLTGEDVKQLETLASMIKDLLGCVEKNYLKCVNVICGNISLWHSLMQKNFIDHSVFSVKHLIHGSTEAEPEYYKIWYNGFSIFSYNTFCITLKNDVVS